MKIGTLLKLGLVGGGIYYVKKQGGLKAAWDKLSTQLTNVKDQVKSQVQDATSSSGQSPMRSMYESDSGFGSSSSYGNEASGSIGNRDKTGY
jgi:hypothetical protein